MAPVDEFVPPNAVTNEEPSKPASVIGIIYPPPEVRNIVDKTASFVARNGPEFETRIRQNEINNPKFNFLNPKDPYYAYYQHKVRESKEGKSQEPAVNKGSILSFLKPSVLEQQAKIVETIVPKEPPAEFEFIADPPSIAAYDLDVVKLTAQFVARNGRQFLTNLMKKEQKNYQFDFLRPQHSLFQYFTKLVEQYTKILIPPKSLLPKLLKECGDAKNILDQVKYRVEWTKFQERQRQKEEEALEKERVAYASVDWHDFVVVETVDFQANERGNFPPPTTPDEVGARMLAQERFQTTGPIADEMEVESDEEVDEEAEDDDQEAEPQEAAVPRVASLTAPQAPGQPPQPSSARPEADTQVMDMEEDSDEEEADIFKTLGSDKAAEVTKPPPPLNSEEIVIRKDYDPKVAKTVTPISAASDQFLISPITGEKIPANKVQEHMRIGLLDPKWLESKERAKVGKSEGSEVYAPGPEAFSSLKQFAERRTDIFGLGEVETQIGKKIGESDDKKVEKATWDGHTASVERITHKARENISIEDQIAVIHKVKGLVQDEEKEKIGPAKPAVEKTPLLSTPTVTAQRPAAPASIVAAPTANVITTRPAVIPQTPVMMVQPRPPIIAQPRQVHMIGIAPRPPMPAMPMPGAMPPGMHPGFMPMQRPAAAPVPTSQPKDDEPPTKKSKTEENLVPEEIFLQRSSGSVTFKVVVPNALDKPEWKLNGQTITLTLPLTDNVSVIKAKLHDNLQMPSGKQKLLFEGMFIKDSNTLAYYNFSHQCTVHLQIKERGGRKK